MSFISILFASVFVFIFKCVNSDEPSRRILYGSQARIEDHPYYAGLSGCGAAIISDRWILTAAHCVSTTRSPKDFVWVGGETFQNSQRVPYDKVIIHPEYRSMQNIPLHDVAVVRLTNPLKFSSKIRPIALPKNGLLRNTKAVFVGRGKDQSGNLSPALMKVDVVRLTTEQCINQIPPEHRPFATHHRSLFEKVIICARRQENLPSICHGDSGSPLVSDDVVIGLASFIGRDCATARLGFYVNVPNYISWIKSVTGL